MSSSNNRFWKNKHVLITGIHGFVGSHLAIALEKKGAKVWGLSRTMNKKNIIKANIIDYSKVDEIIKEKKIDICFHLAAESFVELGQDDPYQTFKVNTLGTLNILESTRINNLEKLIIASTAHVYGKNKLPFKEDYPARPTRPYETSKTAIDLITQSYADTFNLPVLIARCCNIYGPGDTNINRLIPKTMKSVLSGNQPEMWGGKVLREYLYIDDAIDGYIKLAELPVAKMGKNRIFNFGTGKKVTVEEVMKIIITISGKNLTIKRITGGRVNEIHKQYLSSAKSKKILNWSAKTPFQKGLKKTFRWYKKSLKS